MHIVNIAPRRHLLKSTRTIVPPRGDSREFIITADCLFTGYYGAINLYAVFDDAQIAEWFGDWLLKCQWSQPRLSDDITVEFKIRNGSFWRAPLRQFLYHPLGGGIDWGFSRRFEFGQQLYIRVINKSETPIELRFIATGSGELPVSAPDDHPLYPRQPRLVHVDASNYLPKEKWRAFKSGDVNEWITWLVDNGVVREIAESITNECFDRDRRKWSDVPEIRDYLYPERKGVGGYWWRVRKSDGAWSVCRFEVEPVPKDAGDYQWATYFPANKYDVGS